MKFSKTLLVLSGALVVSLGAVACGGTPASDTKTDTPTGTQPTGSQPTQVTTQEGPTSEQPITQGDIDPELLDISLVADDGLRFDGEGNPVFDEEIELDIWSIPSQPDVTFLDKLVKDFNELHSGEIYIKKKDIAHYDYYGALENAFQYEPDTIPDMLLMHNEKTVQYALRQYMFCLDQLIGKTGVGFDFDQVYDNIDRVTQYKGHRFAIPMDAHGFVTQIRQDIIKKNGLGFDGNTRFIPNSRAEYDSLLRALRTKADEGTLLVRSINKMTAGGRDHSWYTVNANSFRPEANQTTDPDGLSSLYANGGSLMDEAQEFVTFQNNEGFIQYCKDQVTRYNDKLMNTLELDAASPAAFGTGESVMFPQGPWWLSQTYVPQWNTKEMASQFTTIGGQQVATGITAEEAADPVYNTPLIASHPDAWWTLEENMGNENAHKWYCNGHALSVVKKETSLTKVAAMMVFFKYLTQDVIEDTEADYNLAYWCQSGHIPAWKNVYESEYYQNMKNEKVVLQALGNPEDVVAMEGLEYEVICFDALAGAVGAVQTKVSTEGMTIDEVEAIINEYADDAQATIDIMKMDF